MKKGSKHSEETKIKISANANPFWQGKKMPKEVREKISKAHKVTDKRLLEIREIKRKEWKRRHNKKKHVYIQNLYQGIKIRLKHSKSYKDRKCDFDKETFISFSLNSKQFNDLYKKWEEQNFPRHLSPPVDRINNSLDYTINNIQFLTREDNLKKWKY